MKRAILGLAALLMAAPALAQVNTATIAVVGPAAAATQAANNAEDNIPTADADGMSLSGIKKIIVIVSAASGQTLSGAGTLKFWYYNTAIDRWIENKTSTISVTMSGRRDQVSDLYDSFPDGAGRIYVEADTVTSSSGALTVRIIGVR